jgi:thiol-disulfide isomerase/thioredoxin
MKTMTWMITTVTIAMLACGGGMVPPGDEKKPAPPLVLDRVDGDGTFSIAEQKGKVVLVDLWATWCAPCIAEIPELQQMHESYDPETFTMVGIVLESGEREDIEAFIKEKSITYPNLFGEEDSKESFGPFLGYPTKYLIDKDGFVVKRYLGAVVEQVTRDVEKLVRTGSLNATD